MFKGFGFPGTVPITETHAESVFIRSQLNHEATLSFFLFDYCTPDCVNNKANQDKAVLGHKLQNVVVIW